MNILNFFDGVVLGGLIIAVTYAVIWIYSRKKQSAGCCGCRACNRDCAGKTR